MSGWTAKMKRTVAIGIVGLFLLGIVGLIATAMFLTWREGKLWIVLAVFGCAALLWWAANLLSRDLSERNET